ncbi:cobalamin B12-binding protein [Pontixanthobacter aestiaquae]|uniref:Cobalamin B12-binding protein n=1 Tax=Pontixanthobacter aestiaquae TaxID=1509367 RepID=A0A844Z9N1_9SPHN|nr:cobalamin B12-binding protein [Pontixanthobacter aestiaquae]MDN3644779.1 cobalamin B12-binding protein [Pontixanthobacter aestiaquae]MXO84214.1 cobalamin B12-binding protein [Pontixanthobacter aestiaquae]
MASDFGLSVLRSRFDEWRQGRKDDDTQLDGLISEDKARDKRLPCSIIDDPRGSANLSLLLENVVIPKLIADRGNPNIRLSKQGLAETVGSNRKRPINRHDVVTFTGLTLTGDASALLDFIDNCLATGSSVESIYVDLLAPSARRLGEFWEDDSEDFVDVTMGLWRIQEVLRELALRVPPPAVAGQGSRSALFSTMPGEQHSLGTLMVAECFLRAGWDADVLIEPSQSELTAKFANRHYDLVGLTLSNDYPSGQLAGLISTIRGVSRNSGIYVMIGGRLVNENPDLAGLCGADATAVDAPSAIEVANALVPLLTSRPQQLT